MRLPLLCCAVSARTSLETASPRNSEDSPRPSSPTLEAPPSLSTASLLHFPQATEARPSASSDVQSPLSPDAATEGTPFTSARLTQHDAAQPSLDPLNPFGCAPQQQPYTGSPLRKSASIDRDPRTRNRGPKLLQKMKRSSSSGSVISKMPNSQPGSLSDTEAAAFQRPTGSLIETSTVGRGSASSLSSSIFGEPNQWVIDYNDLVSSHRSLHLCPLHAHLQEVVGAVAVCMHPWQVLCLCRYSRLNSVVLLELWAACLLHPYASHFDNPLVLQLPFFLLLPLPLPLLLLLLLLVLLLSTILPIGFSGNWSLVRVQEAFRVNVIPICSVHCLDAPLLVQLNAHSCNLCCPCRLSQPLWPIVSCVGQMNCALDPGLLLYQYCIAGCCRPSGRSLGRGPLGGCIWGGGRRQMLPSRFWGGCCPKAPFPLLLQCSQQARCQPSMMTLPATMTCQMGRTCSLRTWRSLSRP